MSKCPHCGREITASGCIWPGCPTNAFKINYSRVENPDRIDYLDHRLAEALRRIDALETRVSFIVSYLSINIQVALEEEEMGKAKP